MPGNRQVFSTAMNAADRFRWDSQWAEAANEYQRALTEFPDDAAARGGLGFCYMQTKQWQKALAEYECILKRDPSNVIALSKTAELYVILNRRDEAYKAYMHLAELYSQAGQGARAEAAWQKAVQLSSTNPEPHERLAAYYLGKKDVSLMAQERLAAAQRYLLCNDSVAATMQCEEVLRVDAANTQAQRVLSQIRGQIQPSGPLPKRAGAAYVSPTAMETNRSTTGSLSSGPLANSGNTAADMVSLSNTSGGNTGIMGNMGSAGNFSGAGNPASALAATGMTGSGKRPTPRKRITASQVTGVLRQAQTFQTQGRFTDAIDLCEQILESGFDRPDARYFLGWLYQEQQRWDEAIRQFQTLLNDPDYALSCYYALGQCYRARGDLRTATVHFDEAVDRVNLDALTAEESDQLVQLCQEAAEAHRLLGEQEQALTVYNALLGFLRSRGWADKVAQVEFMLQQAENMPAPARPMTPPVENQRAMSSDQMAPMPPMTQQPQSLPDAATMAFNATNIANNPPPVSPAQQSPAAAGNASVNELPDWLTGILSDADKTQIANKPASQPLPQQQQPAAQAPIVEQSGTERRSPSAPLDPANQTAGPSWLTDDAKPANATRVLPPDQMPPTPPAQAFPEPVAPPAPVPRTQSAPLPTVPPARPEPTVQTTPSSGPLQSVGSTYPMAPSAPAKPAESRAVAEDLLSQMTGRPEESLKRVAEAVLASTASLPENIRLQVVRSMQDIQNYINHGLLTSATEECLRVIDVAPQYLDVHQVLCEIYVRQGKIEQAITKYAILVDTYVVNGRIDDAVTTYRRILQLEPNNLTYRMRLINLLSSQGNKEDLQRE